MAARGNVDYDRCQLCRRSYQKGKKHVYSAKHIEAVRQALTKFLAKVKYYIKWYAWKPQNTTGLHRKTAGHINDNPWFLRSGEVRESQGKIRKKLGNFTFQSQGKITWPEKVRENHSTRVQKLTKMQRKSWTVLRRLRKPDYLYLHF